MGNFELISAIIEKHQSYKTVSANGSVSGLYEDKNSYAQNILFAKCGRDEHKFFYIKIFKCNDQQILFVLVFVVFP